MVTLNRRRLAAAGLVLSLSLLAGACDSAEPTTTTIVTAPSTTTFAPIEITPVSTTIAPGVDQAVYDELTTQVRELVGVAEDLRGLAFLQVPDVQVLAFDAFAARLAAMLADRLSDERLALEEATYRLLGQYDEPPSIARSIRQVYGPDGAIAFYDGEAAQVVLDGTRAELSALQASIVVRALAWALIDQYHDVFDRIAELEVIGDGDATDALRTLAEADAVAVQLRYLQSLPEADQRSAAAEVAQTERVGLDQLPEVVRAQLAMPPEDGVRFVDEIVAGGGYAALDRAYDPPPASMEQVLHPGRFAIRETIREVPELAVEIDGYETVDDGSYGEWRLRLLIGEAVSPGLLTQTAAGWGGDAHQLLVNGEDMVFVYIYGGDSEEDAIEVAQAFLALARGPLEAGDGIDSGGGVLWEGTSRYVFVDRIGDGLVFIVSTSAVAGASARGQVRVP